VFNKPFTVAQRQKAIGILRSMNSTFSNMRKRHRPIDRRQRDLVRQFRQITLDFADALRSPDAKVDTRRLNTTLARSNAVALEYVMRQISLSGSSDDT
jgi:hypothetical protein